MRRLIKALAGYALRNETEELKLNAVDALRSDLVHVGTVLAAVCNLQACVQADLQKAVDNRQKVQFKDIYSLGDLEGGYWYVQVAPTLAGDGRWASLYVRCQNKVALDAARYALEDMMFFHGQIDYLEGQPDFRGSINGAHGKLVADYQAMMRPSDED
jgi:hypothetical protein